MNAVHSAAFVVEHIRKKILLLEVLASMDALHPRKTDKTKSTAGTSAVAKIAMAWSMPLII